MNRGSTFQAFLEMEDESSAVAMVNYFTNCAATLRERSVYVQVLILWNFLGIIYTTIGIFSYNFVSGYNESGVNYSKNVLKY